jgi:hypothetical protein
MCKTLIALSFLAQGWHQITTGLRDPATHLNPWLGYGKE